MPGPSERSPSGVILEFFDEVSDEPFTAPEIADETGYSVQTVRETLEALVDRELIRSKAVTESEPVWWLSLRDREDDDPLDSILAPADASEGQGSRAARQRLMEQHRQLAQFVTRIDITDDLDEILRLITEEARDLVGAHQSVTSRTVNQDWGQAINAVSISEKYAEYRDYDTRPDGSGIGLALCERIVERHGVRPSNARPGSTGERSESVGGDIWVESESGEWSTFSFTLPGSDP